MTFKKTGKCCLCGGKYIDYGHNPEPLKEYPNRCCSKCNETKVIPERMKEANAYSEKLIVVNTMVKYGGSFVSSLGKALLQADRFNTQKIKSAFPEYWERYLEMGKKVCKK